MIRRRKKQSPYQWYAAREFDHITLEPIESMSEEEKIDLANMWMQVYDEIEA